MVKQDFKDYIGEVVSTFYDFDRIVKEFDSSKLSCLTGLTSAAKSFFLSYFINKTSRPVLLLAPDETTALKYKADIETYVDGNVEFFPAQEASPYELVFSDVNIYGRQLAVLNSFGSYKTKVMVASTKNLLKSFMPISVRKVSTINITKETTIDPYVLADELINLGYKRVGSVVDPGEFSLRGDILDIYPISEGPVRIDFFADQIEAIKQMNIENQRSVRQIPSVTIEPRYEVVSDKTKIDRVMTSLLALQSQTNSEMTELAKNTLNQALDNILSLAASDNYFEGVEYFAPYLYEELADITDYLPRDTVVIKIESHELLQKLCVQDDKLSHSYNTNLSEGLVPSLPYLLHKGAGEIMEKLSRYKQLSLDSFVSEDTEMYEEISSLTVPRFLGSLDKAVEFIDNLRKEKYRIVISSDYPQRVSDVLNEWECPNVLVLEPVDNINITDVVVTRKAFSEGFILPDEKFAVLTDTELFNKRTKRPTAAKKVANRENIDFLVSVNDLSPGDYVVHAKHGLGKFIEMCKQTIDGQERDYLTIEYSGADRLHMPAEQINFLSRYRGAGAPSKLSKMGGADWANVTNKVKKAVQDIAQDLVNLYARRAKQTGFAYDTDTAWQLEMEEAFPYTETPDQQQAINDIKVDMESDKPMDRLICGDVGFGKTEVALRAVFKAVMSGKQVAVVAPTTILAQQHYLNFVERFKPYPVSIDLLSRFRTPKMQKQTIKELQLGEVDIVIGTHRVFQKDVQFKDLGLVVIDEEHRFGVTHKEKLKMLRAEVDVITLSATPIPRTLYMSLSGVRDLSLINTPPVNRAPVKTYVGPYNQSMLRTAINHELDREGQIFFLHNRVQSIYKVAEELQHLVPEARIAIGHGQMGEKELEKIMCDFGAHEYDILCATTIIESGLDIPNANTIIIDDADRFGLAQLYQLRGRVGRSERQAYAYCFYHPQKVLEKDAQDRLKAIKDFNTLGSGYQIALRDLEIRGVGNILGSQQHGHMCAVGFDLYCSLLEDAVRELQGEKVNKKEPPVVDINITAYIPEEWVGQQEQKMIEYKRLADVRSLRELEILEEEWKDRFGDIPEVVRRLIQIIRIRLLAAEAGVNHIREFEGTVRIFTDYEVGECKLLQNNLPAEMARKFKWIKAPQTSQNGKSLIILNNTGLLIEEQLNILEELFIQILKIQRSI